MEDIKEKIAKKIAKILNAKVEEVFLSIENPKDKTMGDFAYPCFKLSKDLRKSPNVIAEDLKAGVLEKGLPEGVADVQTVGAYINFYVKNDEVVKKVLGEIIDKKEKYIQTDEGKGKTICVDYSAPNIAKPFHIGHLRSTVIGGAIYRLYKTLGYKMVGINYLGDFGTQFGYVIEGYKRFGNEQELIKTPIKHLVDIYVRINEMAKEDESIVEAARANFQALEQGKEEETALWEKFRELSLEEYQRIYMKMGVTFDSYNGEAFYNDKMDEVIKMLNDKNLLVESEGAKVVQLAGFDIPCIIIKTNGSTTYATRDLASVLYRTREYNYYKSIYVTSYEQILHFQQMFKVAENIVEEKYIQGLVHVPFGMVLGPGGKKLSTRKGVKTTLEDVLDESIEKAKSILLEKGKVEENIDEVAKIIGVGAIIFNDLKNGRIKDEIFDLDEMLKFEGETGPYVQYMCVRIKSILSKLDFNFKAKDIKYDLLVEKEEIELIKFLSKVREIIKTAAEEYEPSILTRYIIDLASLFSKYYNNFQVITEDKDLTYARAAIVYSTGIVLKEGLEILGIKGPDRM